MAGVKILGLWLAVAALAGCRQQLPPSPPDATLDRLLDRMNERLALMESMARFKYRNGLPAHDRDREEATLRAMEAKARERGLNAEEVRRFFAGQMEAARLLQERFFQQWREQNARPEADADIFDLRARIDRLNDELLNAYIEVRKSRPPPGRIEDHARERIHGGGVDDAVRAAAIRPLLETD